MAVALYLGFADLGRHKSRIEALVTRSVGRPFAIDGPFTLRLLPVVEVSAERVRLGNTQGGSQPQMIEFGKGLVHIDFWSLISGPIDVRLFELHDATVLLERGPDGTGNWVMRNPGVIDEPAVDEDGAEEAGDDENAAPELPLVIRDARLDNVRLIYREAGKSDRVAWLEKLNITPGHEGLLALGGQGTLDVYPLVLKGEVGPLTSLLAARDMRIAMQASLGKLDVEVRGGIGSLSPLDGADLTLAIGHPEFGSMLRKLEFPVFATGVVRIEGRLKDAGELTQLDFNAKVGDLTASTQGTLRALSLAGGDLTFKVEHTEVGTLLDALELPVIASGPIQVDARLRDAGKNRQLEIDAKLGDLTADVKGTLKTLGLVGSDLRFEATATDAARLANVFDISGVPAAPISVKGRTVYSRKQIKFEALTASIAGASAQFDGSVQRTGDRKAELQFRATAESLARFAETWPDLKVSASGALELSKGRVEATNLEATVGGNQLAGSLLLIADTKQIEAQLSSPRLDLTPFFAKGKRAEATAMDAPAATAMAQPATPRKKFVFSETPFRLDESKEIDAKLQYAIDELVLGERSFKDLDGNIRLEHGKTTFDLRAVGSHEGTLQGTGTLFRAGDGTADLELKVDLANVRASVATDGLEPAEVPPLGLKLELRIHGSSPRQMASGANGTLLLTQGPGKMRSGLIAAYSDGVLTQLAQKLNPFARVDPFMKLDCTIARADIVNGEVALKPVVVQSEKVTITAHGNIDLRTEKLSLDFNTRPRKGIGVTPGMFTNPLVRLEGTLVSPRIGVGAKGVASGAVAAATGGVTIVAGGLFDRMRGEADICKTTLAMATKAATR